MTARPPPLARMDPRRLAVPVALVAAVVVMGSVPLSGLRRSPLEERRSTAFQALVGGLGSAPRIDLTAGRDAFDARLGRAPCCGDRVLRAAATWYEVDAPRLD